MNFDSKSRLDCFIIENFKLSSDEFSQSGFSEECGVFPDTWMYMNLLGYIDFDDECWRRNVLVTTIRYWWRFWSLTLTYQHHDVTNITVTVYLRLLWLKTLNDLISKTHPLAGFCPLNVLTEGDDPEESSPLCSFTSGCPICILPLIVFDGPIIPALPLFSWFLNHKWWSTTYQFRMKVITWCKIKIHKLKINTTSHDFSEHWFQRAVHVRERFGLDQIIRINYWIGIEKTITIRRTCERSSVDMKLWLQIWMTSSICI